MRLELVSQLQSKRRFAHASRALNVQDANVAIGARGVKFGQLRRPPGEFRQWRGKLVKRGHREEGGFDQMLIPRKGVVISRDVALIFTAVGEVFRKPLDD